MTDGGGESAREHEQRISTQRKSTGDEFSRAIAKIGVAQVCEIVGFQTFQLSALETLTDVAVRYIHNIGKTAHFYANLAGRMECNVFDIIQGLEDLSLAQGFSGASDVDHCLANSGTVREIVRYIAETEQIPFSYSIPQFPVVKDQKLTPSFWQSGLETPGEHIPTWLPAFPEPHTYAQSSITNERATEPHTNMIEQEKQQRNVERSLFSLQRGLVCNGLEGPHFIDSGDADKEKQARESNPFLAAPLQYGETEVSHVAPPAKLSSESTMENPVSENLVVDKCSVLEAFAPAIEAMKNGSCELEEHKEINLSRRPTVQFKIGSAKKYFNTMLHASPQDKNFQKNYPWLGRENEKDEKKRKAEKILKNSMENSQELAQL